MSCPRRTGYVGSQTLYYLNEPPLDQKTLSIILQVNHLQNELLKNYLLLPNEQVQGKESHIKNGNFKQGGKKEQQ